MLRVEMHALAAGPVDLADEVPADDPLFEDLEVTLTAPVAVRGRMSAASPGRYYWRGALSTTAQTPCRRCLTTTEVPVEAEVEVVFTEDQDAEDPSEYVVPVAAGVLDLRTAVREELLLGLPDYAVCRPDCRGLCPRCGIDRNKGRCDCRPPADPRWAALEALKTNSNE